MIAIKYSETTFCIYSDYGCRDSACPLNKLHESEETHFGITDIEPPGCIRVMDMIFDKSLDRSIRSWIKACHIKSGLPVVPQAIRDIGEGIKPKILTPLERWVRGEDVVVGPGVVMPNNGRKPRSKNFVRHIWEHGLSFYYKIRMNRVHKKINAPSKIVPLEYNEKRYRNMSFSKYNIEYTA